MTGSQMLEHDPIVSQIFSKLIIFFIYSSVSQPVCRELLLGVPPNIFPCDFESLLPTIKHISFEK
jgi:hypothetical protein